MKKPSNHVVKKLGSRAENALTLGKSIRILRNARNLKSKLCAASASISAGMLSLIEHGERQPSVEALKAIADALNVPYGVFVIIEHPTMTGAEQRVYDIVKSIKEVYKSEEGLKRNMDAQARAQTAATKGP